MNAGISTGNYASGTNCRGTATCGAAAEAGVTPYWDTVVFTELTLGIGGSAIKTVLPGGRPGPFASTTAVWDSTHFAPGSVLLTADATFHLAKYSPPDSKDVTVHAEVSVPIKNLAALYGRYDMDVSPLCWTNNQWDVGDASWNGSGLVAPILEGINHVVNVVTDQGWNFGSLASGLNNCSVVYVHTHGATTYFWTDTNDFHYFYPGAFNNSLDQDVYATQGPYALKPMRLNAIGSGLPPFNSTGNPPITIAFMDACDTGTDNSFADALLPPYTNYYSNPNIEDQAELGYSFTFLLSRTSAVDTVFWHALSEGKTADEARQEAYGAYQGANTPQDYEHFLHVWGDFYSRLHGVYTGSAVPLAQTAWYR